MGLVKQAKCACSFIFRNCGESRDRVLGGGKKINAKLNSPIPLPQSMNGALAFVDTSDCTMMNIAEHYMASDVEWDPTGRYVVTSVSWWSHKVHERHKGTNAFLLTLSVARGSVALPYGTVHLILFLPIKMTAVLLFWAPIKTLSQFSQRKPPWTLGKNHFILGLRLKGLRKG